MPGTFELNETVVSHGAAVQVALTVEQIDPNQKRFAGDVARRRDEPQRSGGERAGDRRV